MTTLGDTIAAIATAPGRAGVAVVRVSGPMAFDVIERLTGRPAAPGRIVCRSVRVDGMILDQAVVLAFSAPHSYTGEDVAEFQCHGGAVTPRRILEACLGAGSRLARRGEFTERAFLNGKLDYEQAESVLDLIDARTVRAADAALEGLDGRRRDALRTLYARLVGASVEIEHALDISEDELPESFYEGLSSSLTELRAAIHAAIVSAKEGRLLREGALVVLAGPPNVGKSSLMNALLEENRAIVSDVPGTTRDSIEEWLALAGWPIRLVDTAGLRETEDAIEREGVVRSRRLIDRADVVLCLSEKGFADSAPNGREIRVRTKADLVADNNAGGAEIAVSAKTGVGLDALKAAIVAKLEARAESDEATSSDRPGEVPLAALVEAEALLAGLDDFGASSDLVLVGNALRAASEKLGEVIGANYSSDLLDRLFSRFCVGK